MSSHFSDIQIESCARDRLPLVLVGRFVLSRKFFEMVKHAKAKNYDKCSEEMVGLAGLVERCESGMERHRVKMMRCEEEVHRYEEKKDQIRQLIDEVDFCCLMKSPLLLFFFFFTFTLFSTLYSQTQNQITLLESSLIEAQQHLNERHQYQTRITLLSKQRPISVISNEIEKLENEIANLQKDGEGLGVRVGEERKKYLLFETATRDLRAMIEKGVGNEIVSSDGGAGEGVEGKKKRKRGGESENDVVVEKEKERKKDKERERDKKRRTD
jgi:hypothetical protein